MPMNIAVFTKNWLGDVIFHSPAIRAIKENYPDSRLIAITTHRCVEVLEANPYVDEIIPFDEKEKDRSLLAKFRFIGRLRKLKIDKVYLFHRSSTRARLAWLAGARERIGYDAKGRSFLTCAIPEPEGPIHDVEYFVHLVQQSGLRVEGDYVYQFYFNREDEIRALSMLEHHHLSTNRLIAINPGANWPPKRWPAEYFRELASRLIERFRAQIILTGSGEDEPIVKSILSGTNGSNEMVSLCGKTTVRELGALFSKCRLVISNDTGPLHIAAGTGTNVLGLFGPTQPLETAPLGPGKNLVLQYAPEGAILPWIGKKFPYPWMELISVDEVFQLIEKEKVLP